MSETLRAAVIGASGMGKHHAKWLHQLGCEVVAFVGSSAESVARTRESLGGIIPFAGRGYEDVAEMLDAEQPDLVAIASPHELHYEHAMLAVARGVHVMCEKPLVYDGKKSPEQMLGEAEELVAEAQAAGVVAAVNTQYVAAGEAYRDLAAQLGVGELVEPVRSFFMQMESRGARGPVEYGQIWVDLAPHPLSVLRAMVGPGRIVPESRVVRRERKYTDAVFSVAPEAGGEPVRAHVLVRNVPEGPLTRRLGVNDLFADYQGRNNAAGVYAAYLKLHGVERESPDFVETSLRRFVAAVQGEEEPLADFAAGRQDLEWLLALT